MYLNFFFSVTQCYHCTSFRTANNLLCPLGFTIAFWVKFRPWSGSKDVLTNYTPTNSGSQILVSKSSVESKRANWQFIYKTYTQSCQCKYINGPAGHQWVMFTARFGPYDGCSILINGKRVCDGVIGEGSGTTGKSILSQYTG